MATSFDLIVFGASGFTGQLVAQYLQSTYGSSKGFSWALAGRDARKLAQVRQAVGAPASLPLLTADAHRPEELHGLVRQARAVISTAGPYQLHGQALVTACAEAGTDYVDLCGEPLWMAQMIPLLQAPAAASGARIVFSCGFDSIPFDLGVVFLQHAMQQRLGACACQVRARVRVMKGGFSGGTAASLLGTLQAIEQDPALARVMADPFALTPGFRGPPQPSGEGAAFDDWAQSWSGPFVMAAINTKNVHRTHALRGHPWGEAFGYDERLLTGTGFRGQAKARALACQTWLQNALLAQAASRALVKRYALPQPGQGPSAAEREAGRYEVLFTGQTTAGQRLSAVVKCAEDPGYGSTSKLVSESALCLLRDVDRQATPGGVWTPGAAMGLALVRRLQAHANLSFEVQG